MKIRKIFICLIIYLLGNMVNGVEVKVVRVISNTNRDFQQLQQKSDDVHDRGTVIPIEYIQGYPNVGVVRPLPEKDVAAALQADPLLATLILSYNLHLTTKPSGFNHPQHLPVNPYVSLLLSHYGRYIPTQGHGRGIYGYAAANNYHNNLPFGAYKLYEDVDV